MEVQDYPFDEQLKLEEEIGSWEDDFAELPPNDIVAYNELRSCADIVRMYENRQLILQPDFQRDVVWKKPDQTRFIDSLIKQLPIPSMCISLDFNTDQRLVIDGLQRISTIVNFLTNKDFQLSLLEDVDEKISGKTSAQIRQKNKAIFDRVQNLTIPINVIRCDYSKKSHMDYLFTIFHRLNSGGSKLNNQEIRNCIYNGNFNSFLKESVRYRNYRALFNIDPDKTYRFAFEELNLRFFAFSEWLDRYNGKLAKFLNDYMYFKENDKNGKITKGELIAKKENFQRTIDTVFEKLFNNQSADKLSKSVTEAILIGVSKNLEFIDGLNVAEAQHLLNNLREDDLFSVDSLKEGLSQKNKVITRIKRAIEIFSGE